MTFTGRLESHLLGHPETTEFAIHFPKRDAHTTKLAAVHEEAPSDVLVRVRWSRYSATSAGR